MKKINDDVYIIPILILIAVFNVFKNKKLLLYNEANNCYVCEIHKISYEINKIVSKDTIFTITPIIPLETRIPIYPFTVHSPFSMRVAKLLSKEERRRYNIFSFEELDLIKPKYILLSKDSYNFYIYEYVLLKCKSIKEFKYEIKLYKCF